MYGRKTGKASSMKPGTFPHPNPDQRLQHPYHVVQLPGKAPLHQRLWRAATNLFEEWWAVLPQETADRLYRCGLVLLTLTAIAAFWWLAQAVDITGGQTYYIHQSNRTGQIVRIFDPRGRPVKMTPEEVAKLKHKHYDYVP